MSLVESSATASSTAAISSAFGGSGMYSLAPALIACTAALASVPMPQATTGTLIRSFLSWVTSRATSSLTSIITRSAPWPERSAFMAAGIACTCATLAPRSCAIFPAVVMWPSSEPTMSKRMRRLRSSGFRSSVEFPEPLVRRQQGVDQHFQAARILLPADRGRRGQVDLIDERLFGGVAVELGG